MRDTLIKQHRSTLYSVMNKVYVADRDQEVRSSIQLLLKTENIMSLIFETGQSLLEQIAMEQPVCVVLEANMPDLGGLALLEKMHSNSLYLPVILLGGNSQIPAVVDVVKAGVWDYFEKPFIQHTLIDSVRRAIATQNYYQ